MADTVRHQIVAAIAATNNAEMKAVLLLLLGVLEEIGGKIDAMHNDDAHQFDHEWVQGRREAKCDEVCEWAKKKMIAEKDAAEDARIDRRSARDAAIRQVVTILCSAAAGIAGALWMMK